MRPETWPQMLADYLMEARAMGFVWGRNDCVLFGANWVRSLTGTDPLKGYRGRWSSARGAARLIDSLGAPLGDLVNDCLVAAGFEEVPPARAGRGDIVLAALDHGLTVGIVGDHRACFLTDDARAPFAFLATRDCVRAWRIA